MRAPDMQLWRGRARRHWPALAGYVVVTVAFFWPVVAHIHTRILSDGRDGATFLWSMWAFPKDLFAGRNPFETNLMFHPVGARLGFHTNIPLESILAAPVARVFGFAVAANLLRLGATVLSGFGAYLLAFQQCRSRLPAFVAGAAFALAPYQIASSYGHFNLQQTQFLPLGILALLLLIERPTRLRAAGLGLCLAASVATDFYYTVFLLGAWVVVALWKLPEIRPHLRTLLLRGAEAAGLAVVLTAPLLVEWVRELVTFKELDPLRNWGAAELFSADVLSWVVPPSTHPIWGSKFAWMNLHVTGGDRMAFTGFLVLVLGLVSVLWGETRRRHVWTTLAAVFAVLSFGPFLHIRGWHGATFSAVGSQFTIPMPFALLHFVPILNGVRTPGRFSIMTMLALCVLMALLLTRLAQRWPEARTALCMAALGIVLLESLPGRLPFQPANAPAPYRAIAADRGRRAVLELPLVWRTGFGAVGAPVNDASNQLFYATQHGKPLVSGFHARYPEHRILELSAIPLYRQVMSLQGMPGFYDPVTFGVSDLQKEDIGYVVYHRDNPQPRALEHFTRLALPVLAEDRDVTVWRVP